MYNAQKTTTIFKSTFNNIKIMGLKNVFAKEIKLNFYLILIGLLITFCGYLFLSFFLKPNILNEAELEASKIRYDSIYNLEQLRLSKEFFERNVNSDGNNNNKIELKNLSIRELKSLAYKDQWHTNPTMQENVEVLLPPTFGESKYDNFNKIKSGIISRDGAIIMNKNRVDSYNAELQNMTLLILKISILSLIFIRYLILFVKWVVKYS
jgi:hypothetical protein